MLGNLLPIKRVQDEQADLLAEPGDTAVRVHERIEAAGKTLLAPKKS